jgi:hypothetical protein
MFYVLYPFVTYLLTLPRINYIDAKHLRFLLPESRHGSDHVSDGNKSNEEYEPLS